jgi:molybdopterin-guanine dinucleotide biosynthesis protein A
MGRDKAFVQFNGRPMFAHVASMLASAGCDPIVIGKTGIDGVASTPDDEPGRKGPAGGLATALRLANGRQVVLVAADQPLLDVNTVRALLGLDGEAVVPVDRGVRQATCAVYREPCAAALARLLAAGGSPPLQRLLNNVATRDVEKPEWSAWGESGKSWWSLDTASDLAQAETWLAGHSASGIGESAM